MAIQKKSLISGNSTPKKATSTMPQVSEKPGLTKVAHIRLAATKVASIPLYAATASTTGVGSPSFGVINSQGNNPRLIRFALRLSY